MAIMGEFISGNATGSYFLVTSDRPPFFMNRTSDPLGGEPDNPSLMSMFRSGIQSLVETAGRLIG
jgi:hypothetical protein